MSQQAEEWDDMTETQRTEILSRLNEAASTKANVAANIKRQQLERASRSGLAEALAPFGI